MAIWVCGRLRTDQPLRSVFFAPKEDDRHEPAGEPRWRKPESGGRCWLAARLVSGSLRLGPPVVPFYPFFGGQGSPAKRDKPEKNRCPYSNLSKLEELGDVIGILPNMFLRNTRCEPKSKDMNLSWGQS